MSDQQLVQRISSDPKVMVGKPVIKGTRRERYLATKRDKLGHRLPKEG